MTNRTVQFWGQGYSTPPSGVGLTPCTITATIDGVQVFSGIIPTTESTDIGRLPTDQQVLFQWEIPMNFSGTVPVSLQLTGSDVYLEQILANYAILADNTSSGPDVYEPIYYANGECKSNVTCTGAVFVSDPPPDPRPAGIDGQWGWEIEPGAGNTAIFSYDLSISVGKE